MVLIIIGAFLFIVGIVWWAIAVTRGTTGIGSLVVIVLAVIALVFGAKLVERRSPQPEAPKYKAIEYPASKFDLKLKVTEYDGKRDTAYVLFFLEGTIPLTKEHLASEYELKLRIVEFEGQRDTTYVLVKKIKEYEICQ